MTESITPAELHILERDRSKISTPNQHSTAALSGPPIPGVQSSEPGNRCLRTCIALTNLSGWAASCAASTKTTIPGFKSGSTNASSCDNLCQDTGRRGPIPAGSPASASSNEGGNTCPIDVCQFGALMEKSGGDKFNLDSRVIVAGILSSVKDLNGAKYSSSSGSPRS